MSDQCRMRVDAKLSSELAILSAAAARSQPLRVMNEPRQPLSASRAQALLAGAWQAVLGEQAPARGVALLTAQWALETDSGRSMPGHNFAGIKAAPLAAGASFRTVEGYGAARREVSARFRVYDSAESGARDYLRLLAQRYPAALDAARTGDIPGFSSALAAGGYFTADPHAYARGLEQRVLDLNGESGAASREPAPCREGALWGLLRALQREPDDA